MSIKKRIALIIGGKSLEHEVSIRSGINILNALDLNKYTPLLIGITKTGKWYHLDSSKLLIEYLKSDYLALDDLPGVFIEKVDFGSLQKNVDMAFIVLHGFGEDGSVQGFLKVLNIPFVGCDILSSAICMDKDISKRILRESGLNVAKHKVFRRAQKVSAKEVEEDLGFPVFVKPSRSGSSVGIEKVSNEEELKKAIHEAFKYDHKVIVEESIDGMEIECAILGNDKPIASLPSQVIVTGHAFYNYDAKYLDNDGWYIECPAKLPSELSRKIQEESIKAYKASDCQVMARVDCFVTKDETVYINEINTIPGFANISQYPKMWDVSGIAYQDLISKLIDLSFEYQDKENSLIKTFSKTTLKV